MMDSLKMLVGVIAVGTLLANTAFASIDVPEPATATGLVLAGGMGGALYMLHRIRHK
jgi:predicted lipoprotein with Yx(FWY)xxD motif